MTETQRIYSLWSYGKITGDQAMIMLGIGSGVDRAMYFMNQTALSIVSIETALNVLKNKGLIRDQRDPKGSIFYVLNLPLDLGATPSKKGPKTY